MKFWIGWVLGLAVMLLAVVWGFSQWNLHYYKNYIGERMELLAELRRGALLEYFSTAQAELRFWSKNRHVIEAQQRLNAIWMEDPETAAAQLTRLYVEDNPSPPGYLLDLDDAGDGGAYSSVHARTHPLARQFVTRRGYYDFFLIGPGGDVYYSVEKEPDYATNLLTGPWRDSGLAQVFVRARDGESGNVVALSDMRSYGPSGDAAAIFTATAIHAEDGQFLGVLALQLPTDRILGIMAYKEGMGDSGETYVVGEDLLMRSDSRFSETGTVLSQKVDTDAVHSALAGEQGRAVIDDYRGVPVMSGYAPLQLGEHRWAVLAEIDMAEIAVFAATERPSLAPALLLIYGLSIWTVWYWRGRSMPGDSIGLPDGDLPESLDPGAAG